jgi:ATP-dependent exoDNAse (exonuclease V) beta subunit
LLEQSVAPSQMMVVVRSHEQLDRALGALELAGIPGTPLASGPSQAAAAFYETMHEAKGLEFRAVAVMACDDDVLPLRSRIEAVSDEADLDEVYNTERHLLYVAATRARDFLLLTSGGPSSEFLDDFDGT